jgi:hypothetical protein
MSKNKKQNKFMNINNVTSNDMSSACPRSLTEVEQYIEQLNTIAAMLRDQSVDLENQFKPVLREDYPRPASCDDEPPVEKLVPVADEIRSVIFVLESVFCSNDSILSRAGI